TNDHRPRADEPVERTDPLGRRQFLRGLAGTGALVGAGGLLAACGSSGTPTPAAGSPTATGARKRAGSLEGRLTHGPGSGTPRPPPAVVPRPRSLLPHVRIPRCRSS